MGKKRPGKCPAFYEAKYEMLIKILKSEAVGVVMLWRGIAGAKKVCYLAVGLVEVGMRGNGMRLRRDRTRG